MAKLTEVQAELRFKLARRLEREFRLMTEHGDRIELANYEADTLAEIIAEYVDGAIASLPHDRGEG